MVAGWSLRYVHLASMCCRLVCLPVGSFHIQMLHSQTGRKNKTEQGRLSHVWPVSCTWITRSQECVICKMNAVEANCFVFHTDLDKGWLMNVWHMRPTADWSSLLPKAAVFWWGLLTEHRACEKSAAWVIKRRCCPADVSRIAGCRSRCETLHRGH